MTSLVVAFAAALGLIAAGSIDLNVAAVGALLGTLIGAYVSVRLLRPRQRQIVAAAENELSAAADRMIGRYAEIVERQDAQLAACHTKIDELTRLEHDCEVRADRLAERVADLEAVIDRHGLNTS